MIEQLLDTRVLLLFLQNDPALPDPLAKRIESPQNRSLVSLAEWRTMRRAAGLPSHHSDPTDRILVAEAITRNIPILSLDETFDLYKIPRISG